VLLVSFISPCVSDFKRDPSCIGKESDAFWTEHEINQKLIFQLRIGCAGEAIYCDDIPSPPYTLYAAFVLSTEPLAKVKGVDTTAALGSVGAVDFVSASDFPKKDPKFGVYNPYNGTVEPLFAEDRVGYVGQPLGLMVNSSFQSEILF